MPFIEWNEKYETKITSIDRQHKKLVEYINKIDTLKNEKPNNRDEISRVLGFLVEYCDSHFKYEESCFKNFKYEGEEEHKKVHEDLKAQVISFQKGYDSGTAELTDAIMSFLKNWLVNHICIEDFKYLDCFHEHKLK